MPMRFEELDEATRRLMLVEFEAEEASGKPYRARGLSSQGLSVYHDLMREAIQSGTEETLIAALANPAFGDRHEIYYPIIRRTSGH